MPSLPRRPVVAVALNPRTDLDAMKSSNNTHQRCQYKLNLPQSSTSVKQEPHLTDEPNPASIFTSAHQHKRILP